MAADFPTMWAENRGFLAYPIRTRNCIFTQLHCRRRHKKPYIDTEERTIEAIRCEWAARRAIANLKERHKKRALLQIERLKRFGLMTARRDIANLKERHKMPKIERLKRFGARGLRDAISRI